MLLLILPLVFLSFRAEAQLVIDNTIDAEEALDIIIGDGISFFNVTFSGDDNQIGSFNSTNSNILIEDGMMLATGDCDVAIGPNNAGGSGLGGGNFGTNDPDLDDLSTFNTNDAAVLEFDFVAEGDSVSFQYTFASEEYNEYVCGSVNDAFGFFLSGPGITGPYTNDAINLAIIPGTDIPVTINTVNLGVSGSAGTPSNCDQVSPDWDQNTEFYVDNDSNTDPNSTQFDGFTVVLTAASQIECGEQYHIKIAIADAGDTAFDSAVFLEAGSFSSNAVQISGEANVETDITLPEATILEDCVDGTFTFTINTNEIDVDTVFFEIGGSAENGVDYELIDDFFVIDDDFDGHFDLDIIPFGDGEDEDDETVTISYIFENECGFVDTTQATLTLIEHPGLSATLTDVTLCPNQNASATPEIFLGVGPFTYEWSSGDTTATAELGPGEWDVIITDYCGVETEASMEVFSIPYEDMVFELEGALLCPGESVTLDATPVDGGIEPFFYQWDNFVFTPLQTFEFDDAGIYTVTVTDSCGVQIDLDVAISNPPVDPLFIETGSNNPDFGDESTLVEGCSDGYIWLINPNGAPVEGSVEIIFNGSASNGTDIEEIPDLIDYDPAIYGDTLVIDVNTILDGLSEGIEEIDITLSFTMNSTTGDCSYEIDLSDILFLTDPDPVSVTANDVFICPGSSENSVATVDGGYSPFTYSWSTGGGIGTEPFSSGDAGSYSVEVTDACGQTAETSITVSDAALLGTLPPDEWYCLGTGTGALFTGGVDPINFDFDELSLSVSQNGSFEGILPGVYEITAIDACGQLEVNEIEFISCDTFIPNVFTPGNSDSMNDYFYIDGIAGFPESRLLIYNRWGNLVFEADNYANDWAGVDVSGNELSQGTYYYVFERSDGENFAGDVMLIRK